ncbi:MULTISPECIES: hypothetical protein [Vibrio]|jgi:hypothetical protein|uniref:hypothetical protein n=1 Tax=Vibrio TaxID=662 RepID=UPI00168D7641|nr:MULTISPECIES: hypothetical protein [Vibrio]MCR9723182.1 hypothetical protein [Vibrio parahaemolyticus]MCR9741455.1 hypothetical protein [Vibrio parahaemolyticus]MDW3059311.1 hypothetical protein [Vibrio sp. 1978]HCE3205495.1 hypothetical protein [Vibrio parahaemolyticus]
MSAAVTFEQFCQRYEYDPRSSLSRFEYEKYKENLEIANELITKDAIDKMKT